MDDSLEKRILRLEHMEAIRDLKSVYCLLVDAAVAGNAASAEELIGYFVPDAWVDFADFGYYKDREGLRTFFRDVVPGLLSFSAHMAHNPLVSLSEDTATAQWVFEVPCTLRANNMAGWLQGRTHETFVRVGSVWKWQSIKAIFNYATPFDEGWAQTPMYTPQDG